MFFIHSDVVNRVVKSIENTDAPFLTETRATIHNQYFKVVSYVIEPFITPPFPLVTGSPEQKKCGASIGEMSEDSVQRAIIS